MNAAPKSQQPLVDLAVGEDAGSALVGCGLGLVSTAL